MVSGKRPLKRLRIVVVLSVIALILMAVTATVRADAIVVTRAMKASTIAEIFVESDEIRVDLEIGVDDLDAFRNLMPDEIYERLGHDPAPPAERLDRFLTAHLVVEPIDDRWRITGMTTLSEERVEPGSG